ncbi:MAG: GNAT family N-acetyltransferase [Alphaproteobacteria bacterium]|nr:GNAT family N-acetyltransferase [Alphaproteobacteria bacterium]
MGCGKRTACNFIRKKEKMNAQFLTSSFVPNARPVIRPLTADDSVAYRDLRTKILAIGDGKYFSDSYEREKQFTTEHQWRDWCTETREHCIIGIFDELNLIGVMMITMQGLPGSVVAEWEATWLDPRYRGCGIAKPAYEKVQQWSRDNGYEYAVVYIRDDNQRSREIREKQGFTYVRTKHEETWADGSKGDAHFFVLDLLAKDLAHSPYRRATETLEETLTALMSEGTPVRKAV